MTYSVWYYPRGSVCGCEAQGLCFKEAGKLFKRCTTSAFAKAGCLDMIRLFDSDYNIIAEWQYRKGIVFGEMPSTK